jgi:hypothetical protein
MTSRDKYHDYDEFSMDENTFNVSPLKLDNELYKEEYNIKYPLYNVKRKKNGWELIKDEKVILKIMDSDLSKEQIEKFKTVDGFKGLLSKLKSGSTKLEEFI